MDATAIYNFPYPELGDDADASAQLEALAMAVEAAYTDTTFSTYTPSWTSVGAGVTQPTNPATRVGYYRVDNGWCDLTIYMSFGPATTGGTGYYNIGLPVLPSATYSDQCIMGKLWIPTQGPFPSMLHMYGGQILALPMCVNTDTNPQMIVWGNADTSGAAGTGRPQIPGTYTVQNGGHIGWTGRYRV